jgi:hypothetical protein
MPLMELFGKIFDAVRADYVDKPDDGKPQRTPTANSRDN